MSAASPNVLVLDFAAAQLPALAALEAQGVPPRWQHLAEAGIPARLLVLIDGSTDLWVAAALLTSRNNTGYLKIVDVLGASPSQRQAAVQAVVALARTEQRACVKWEAWGADTDQLQAGFTKLPAPRRAPDATGPSAGFIHWLQPTRQAALNHYQQSENFSCAAVAALAAHQDTASISSLHALREAEILLWRQATNFMACEPVGLGLAISRRWPDTRVTVYLDTDKPVIVDYYPEAERGWRGILQADARREAQSAALPLDPQRLSLNQLRDKLHAGSKALLLISLESMLGYAVPHWVLCHGVTEHSEKPVFVLDDSWVNTDTGETWVDATQLPVDADALDVMSSMEDDGYRAAVLLD